MLLKRANTQQSASAIAMYAIVAAGLLGTFIRVQSDFLNGMVNGVRIGLLLVALVMVAKAARLRRAGR